MIQATPINGRGINLTGNGAGGIEFFPVPNISTYMGLSTTPASTYRDADIAMRNSPQNSRMMREDCSIMECLEARQRAVALLKWHVQPENDRSQEQKDLATEMTRIMERTQRFIELRRNLLEAIWFGKAGVQMHFRRTTVNGYRRTAICKQDDNPDALAWSPVHGDKIVFRNDDPNHLDLKSGQYPFQMGIRIGASWAGRMLPGNYIPEPIRTVMRGEVVDRGLAYFLRPEDRKRFIVHKHMIEDGAYEDLLSAGSIHGVGIRSRIYWDWLQKQQIQGMLIAYIERTHGGIEIYRYPVGNAEAETAVRNSINQRVPGRAALLVPVPMGEDAFQYGVEIIEPGMQGISAMQDLLGNFFGHRIKRYILGQTLSTEADATGLGSGVADLHLESFLQIVEYDATNLEETITDEMLSRLQFNNFPASKGIRLQFKIDTQDADTQKKLEALHLAWEMNAQVPEREVFDAVGISPATENDRVLPGPGGGQGMPSHFQQPHGATVSVPEQIGETPQPEQFSATGQPDRYAYASREPDLRSAIDKAAAETDTEPSEAQRISGNYRKGQFHWNGWTIAIENPAGSIRRGRNSLGVEWENKMPVHYGYFRRTESDADGDHLDVFVGPDPESPVVFVVDQIKGNGHFDEHKVLIGFLSEKEAIEAYKASYSKDWNGLKNITAMTVEQFRNWLEDGDTSYEIADQVSKYGQREFVWNEDEHPRNDKGEFVEKSNVESRLDAVQHGARRSRTDILFEKPIIGPSGAKLTGYSWKWTWEIDPDIDEEVRVSDWDESVPSDHTGRNIVHQFSVFSDGKEKTTSLESSMKLLGLADDTLPARKVRNLATTAIAIGELEMQLAKAKAEESPNRWTVQGIEQRLKDAHRRKDRYEKEAEMMLSGKSPADHYRETAKKAIELFHMFKSDHLGNRWVNVMVDRLADEWMRRTSSSRQDRNEVYESGRIAFNDLAKSINATSWGDKRPKTPDPDWTDAKLRNWFTDKGEDAESAIDAAEEWLSKYHPAFKPKPRRQLRDGQVEMRQAKAGGETSDVDGKFYKGGQWLPVHGLSVKSDTEKKTPKTEGTAPVANENARPTARSLSPEQIEAEKRSHEESATWSEIHGGPLGKVLGLGPQPHRIKWGHGILSKYMEVANSFGAAEPRFENVAEVARQIAKEYHSKASQEDWDYLSSMVEMHANDDLGYAPRQYQKYLQDNPSILLARRWIEEAIEASGRDIGSLAKINAAFDL